MNYTVYDSAFKTIVEKMPKLVIPVVNEIFNQNYSYNEKITHLLTEYQKDGTKIISDSVLEIKKCLYHIECQSKDDSTMSIRMIEYDFKIALDNAEKKDDIYEMHFPRSAVIYVRHSNTTPDKLKVRVIFPDGSEHIYSIPTMKFQQYDTDEIFEKDLLMALPFRIIKYEEEMPLIAKDPVKRQEFLDEYNEIINRLEKAQMVSESDSLYKDLIVVMQRVADYVLRNYDDIRDEVDNKMKGIVFELPSDKLREQRAEGKLEGKLEEQLEFYKRCIKKGMSKEDALELSMLPEDKIPESE